MKQNLAKVLGMEEYNEEPNIRVEPTEDEVIQIEQDKFVQEMADHSEATAEALEAIGNAQALASVIARNDSTDKTTYELLKVAVEQLKEKTGVKTQSVSLESLDKYSYKTEALQDVKNFVVKIWEAIKKAFFSMWEKVKAFFKGLFDRNKSIEKEADEIAKDAAELEKEINKAPKTPEQAKNYSSDYFGVKKNYFEETKGSGAPALGYTPGTTNKTTVGGFKTSDKDVDYSDNEYDRAPGTNKSHGDVTFSSEVIRYFGVPVNSSKKGDVQQRMAAYVKSASKIFSLIELTMRKAKTGGVYSEGIEVPDLGIKDSVLIKDDFPMGRFAYELSVTGGKMDLKIDRIEGGVDYQLMVSSPVTVRTDLVPYVDTITSLINDHKAQVDLRMESLESWIKSVESTIQKYPEDFENKQDELKKLRDGFNDALAFSQSCISAHVVLSNHLQRLCKAILKYMQDSINYTKHRYASHIKTFGFIKDIRVLEETGLI